MSKPEGNSNETIATQCGKWPEWLHDAVDEALGVSDKLDWSSEQLVAYAILSERTKAAEIAESYNGSGLYVGGSTGSARQTMLDISQAIRKGGRE